MKGKSISILGCGWLGRPLGAALIERGHIVSGSTTTPSKLEELKLEGISPYLIHLDNDLHNKEVASFFKSDILIISIPPKLKLGGGEQYISWMKAVADKCAQSGVNNVLFLSSTAVYPNINNLVEEQDADTNHPLFRAEQLFTEPSKFDTTVVRFAGLVGPSRHPGRFLAGKTNLPDGLAPINLIHQKDCIEIILQIIERGMWGEVFNACADLHPVKKDFYKAAALKLELPEPSFREDTNTTFKIISAQKMKNALNYQFFYPNPMTMV